MTGPRTLRNIRRDAPRGDRGSPALTPSPKPDASGYVSHSIYPRTLGELRTHSRDYADAAVADALWATVTAWLMNGPHEMDLSNPTAVANLAVSMVRENDMVRLGWPHHAGKEWPLPRLSVLSPDVREEAERVAAETLADWKKAGRPHLGADRVKTTYQYLTACPAFRDRYIKPADDAGNKESE